MAADSELEKKQLKAQLSVLVGKVPPAINSASVQVVREYKKTVAEVYKSISNNRVTASKLSGLLRTLQGY